MKEIEVKRLKPFFDMEGELFETLRSAVLLNLNSSFFMLLIKSHLFINLTKNRSIKNKDNILKLQLTEYFNYERVNS